MGSNKRLKVFQRALARYGLYTATWLFKYTPYRIVCWVADFFVAIGYFFTRKQRAIAEESLQIAFGEEKTPEEIQKITKDCLTNLGWGMIEMFYLFSHPKAVLKKVTFEGKEILDEAMKKEQGVIAVTAHFGNFPLMMLACSLAGYDTSSIIRPTRDEKLEEYLFNKRTELGLDTVYAIPRAKCVSNSIKALRDNKLLFVPLDQNYGSSSGVFVDFFGHKAATATGPVVFARRTKAVIVPMFIVRLDHDHHKIIIEPPIEIEEKENEEKTLVHNIAKITKLIEQYIRKYPHEWGWMHRRWKSKPSIYNRGVVEV